MARARAINASAAMWRVSVLDDFSPTMRRWIEQMSPGALRAVRRGAARARLVLRRSYDVFLRSRSGRGRRGIKYRVTKSPGGFLVQLWPSVGYAAAQELGSRIPPAIIQASGRKVLKFQSQGQTFYRRTVTRRAFNLTPRPWVSSAAALVEQELLLAIQAEYEKIFEIPTTGPMSA